MRGKSGVRFFVDECISPSLSRYLNAGGLHDAIHPRDRGRLRDLDHVVFARAIAEDRIVATENAEDAGASIRAAAPRRVE
jgi:predicted nuclease of predicted toxin-antitoxin system